MNYKKLTEEKLREAASLGDVETVKDLLSRGVDVNSRNDVNGWTALHWAAHRGHSDVAYILLENGAHKACLTHSGDTAYSLSSCKDLQILLGGKVMTAKENKLPIVPNYLRNPPLVCSNMDYTSIQKTKHVADTAVNIPEKALILRLECQFLNEFVEIEIPELTYKKLIEVCCEELVCSPTQILKIIKLPNTLVRNDKDVNRLKDFTEIRVFLKENTHKQGVLFRGKRKIKKPIALTNYNEADVSSSSIATSKNLHHLQTKPGRVSAVRKYCKSCYEKNAAQNGRKIARNLTKQVITFCDTCEGQPFLCLPCFNKIH